MFKIIDPEKESQEKIKEKSKVENQKGKPNTEGKNFFSDALE